MGMIWLIINKELGVYDLFSSYYERDSFTSIFKPTVDKPSLRNTFSFGFTNNMYQTVCKK
jgi:hypothetical protein